MNPTLRIGSRDIGPGRPALVIAEVAQAHDGSLGTAHAFIDAAAAAGADAIKFQTHIAAAESTSREPWRVKFSPQDASRFDYWRRMEFTPDQWRGLKEHAENSGLLFLSSPFSPEAADLLDGLGMVAWKVASGEITNRPLLRRMAATGKPVLLSSGMSSWTELDAAVAVCREARAPFAVFQCTTAYPCPPERLGLNLLDDLRRRYACPVGLSDHSGEIYAGLAAASLGANLIEVHVAFSKQMFGPDAPASLTFEQLHRLVEGVRFIGSALAAPVDKDAFAAEAAPLRRTFGKSIVARTALPAGTVLAEAHLALKKPGTGLPPAALPDVLGRRLRRALAADEELAASDLEV